ncbi:MAG: hypothetical protein NTV70_06310 [Acidobacteria bacterium]|nr:hypothetical protein [Acidobacteriota bacterium]
MRPTKLRTGPIRWLAVNLLLVLGVQAQAPPAAPPRTPAAQATAQAATAQAATAQTVPTALRILVLEGGNVMNSIPLGRAVPPVVEVRDANDFPVEGATVVFVLPETGPGGTFPGNQTTLTTRTTSQGQATAPFLINGVLGRFEIKVTATSSGRKGEATITQTNTNGAYIGPMIAATPWYKKKLTWILIGGAAGGGILSWRLTSGTSSASPTLVLTPGGPVFGR